MEFAAVAYPVRPSFIELKERVCYFFYATLEWLAFKFRLNDFLHAASRSTDVCRCASRKYG